MSQGLEFSLKQQIKITTQLVQSMEFLALSSEEVAERVKKEAETNPSLLVNERGIESYSRAKETYIEKNNRAESYSEEGSPFSSQDNEEKNWIEALVSREESLQEHLLSQLNYLTDDLVVKEAAKILITSLDKNGFLKNEVFTYLPERLKDKGEVAISIIKTMDPSGVGAKDWKESLIIQLEENGCKEDEIKLFKTLIIKELENVKNGKLDLVAKDLKIEREDVEAMVSLLKTLTPYPGLKYSSDYETYIAPEISIKKDEEGKLRIRINEDIIPSVDIDSTYVAMEETLKEKRSEKEKETLRYLRAQINSARSLIALIKQRNLTLEKIAYVLLEKQKEFFLTGPKALAALTMGEVAYLTGYHESTVSRVASSKYIDTDFGVFPIRSLFINRVKTNNGEDISKTQVKEKIKEIINENDTGKPLSDQKISERLEAFGIVVARRTVNKYRKELDLESSFNRKK